MCLPLFSVGSGMPGRSRMRCAEPLLPVAATSSVTCPPSTCAPYLHSLPSFSSLFSAAVVLLYLPVSKTAEDEHVKEDGERGGRGTCLSHLRAFPLSPLCPVLLLLCLLHSPAWACSVLAWCRVGVVSRRASRHRSAALIGCLEGRAVKDDIVRRTAAARSVLTPRAYLLLRHHRKPYLPACRHAIARDPVNAISPLPFRAAALLTACNAVLFSLSVCVGVYRAAQRALPCPHLLPPTCHNATSSLLPNALFSSVK